MCDYFHCLPVACYFLCCFCFPGEFCLFVFLVKSFFCSMFFVVQGLFGKAFGSKFFSHETFLLFSEGEFVLKHVQKYNYSVSCFLYTTCISRLHSSFFLTFMYSLIILKKSGLPLIFYSIIFFKLLIYLLIYLFYFFLFLNWSLVLPWFYREATCTTVQFYYPFPRVFDMVLPCPAGQNCTTTTQELFDKHMSNSIMSFHYIYIWFIFIYSGQLDIFEFSHAGETSASFSKDLCLFQGFGHAPFPRWWAAPFPRNLGMPFPRPLLFPFPRNCCHWTTG